MVDKFAPHQAARNIHRASMRVDMIGTVLRIILHDEYNTLLPNAAPAQMLHKHADGKIIVGNFRKRRGAIFRSPSV